MNIQKKEKFFTNLNARRIQACRRKIIFWSQEGWINDLEHISLLASLINSMDKVANTAGTYYAYLKKWYRKALKDFNFELITPIYSKEKCYCYLKPAEQLIKNLYFDILYLDPPYNQRSYAHYYHLPETIALEISPKVYGMAGIPKNITNFSRFNKPNEAKNALIDLLSNAKFKLLAFHYADDGIIPQKDIRDILSLFGEIEEFIINSKGYTTQEKARCIGHHLYLVHYV